MSFTYGLSTNESEPYLKLPPGKTLRLGGPVTDPIAPAPEAAPDVLLSAATLVVTANLEQDENLQTISPGKIAVARNWCLASPEQQNALIAEFGTLLVRTYSTEKNFRTRMKRRER